jgi:hypothetical protein
MMTRSWVVGAVVLFGITVELWVAHIVLNLPRQIGFLLDAATLIGLIELLGMAVHGDPLGVLIDERNKMSLSRLQITIWTVIILSALAAIGLSRVQANVSDPLAIAIPQELLWVLGITATALVGTPLIHKVKADAPPSADGPAVAAPTLPEGKTMLGRLVVNTTSAGANWTDMFMGEEGPTADRIDLGKVQMFYFTVIAALVYALSVFQTLGGSVSTVHSLPAVSGGLAALLGLSNGAYLLNKVVPRAGG